MKKFLSLVLALVMAMSLVTVSAGAKDFNDSDKISDIAYEEAVNVMSEMGIIDGYGDGNFQPQGTLTRGAAAKIIACMMLGKTTAEALGTQAAPFKDVPVGSTFAGYIAYCVESGIIDGYSDGTFRPGNTLTGFAFLKMLLTALGYDSAIEGYANNANWTVNVAGRAKQIGLLDGNDEFVGTRAATREEACLYAVNALQATLVEYSDKGGSISVGDITINTGASNATYVTSNVYDAATSINNYTDNERNGWTVEFAEKYQPELALKDTVDVFGRPAHTWTWKKAEIGTYVEYDKMVGEYTEKVTGKDLVDLLTRATIEDNEVFVYIDGVTDVTINPDIFGANNMIKTNTEKVGATGDGVLTQVFLDTVEDEITVAIINTYLAQADEDYNEKTEDLDLTVYKIDNKGTKAAPAYVKTAKSTVGMTVEVEDFDIEGVSEDDLFLVTVADGVIQTMEAPEVLSESSVTSFKLGSYVTADGTQYDYADTAMYDEEVLDQYDDKNMKDVTYNVILDPYGYMIGIELNSDPDQYVFLTGIDLGASNLAYKNADANVIFMDGQMDTVVVNMKDSSFNYSLNGANAQLNTWCTYTVGSDGIYTLKEVAAKTDKDAKPAVKVAQNPVDVAIGTANNVKINQKNVSLNVAAGDFAFVYGNDETVYLNVELDNITDRADKKVQIIDDVESVSVGIKNVDIEVAHIGATATGYAAPSNEIYALYNKDGYVIAAVTIGENNGISASYAYITSSSVNREALTASETASYALNVKNDDATTTSATKGIYRWTREAIVDGKLVELSEVGDNLKVLNTLAQGEWYEIKYDANGNVRKAETITYSIDGSTKFVNNVGAVKAAVNKFDTVLLADVANVEALTFKNGTLYTDTAASEGFYVSPDVKVVLALADKGGKEFDDVEDTYTGWSGLEKALKDLNADTSKKFTSGQVEVSAILKGGPATVIVINDTTPDGSVQTGGVVTGTASDAIQPKFGDDGKSIKIDYQGTKPTLSTVLASIQKWLENTQKMTIKSVTYDEKNGYYVFSCTDSYGYPLTYTFDPTTGVPASATLVSISIDGKVVDYATKGVTYSKAGYAAGDYLAETKSAGTPAVTVTDTDKGTGTLTISDTSKDRKLYTAYKVTLDTNVSATLGGKAIDTYVAKGEQIVVKFEAAGTYEVNGNAKYYDKDATVTLTVNGAINVKAYQTAEELSTAVATAAKAAGVTNGTKTDCSISGLDLEAGTATLTITGANPGGTNLINLAEDLVGAGCTIKVYKDSSKTEWTTISDPISDKAALKTQLAAYLPGSGATKVISVEVVNAYGQMMTYAITVINNYSV